MDYRLYGDKGYPEKPSVSSLEEVEKAGAFFVVGEDVSLHHPVLALSVAKGCMEAGNPLYLLATSDSFLYKFAKVHANPLPGWDERVLEALVLALDGEDYKSLLEGSGVSPEVVEGLAQGVKERRPLLIGGNHLSPAGKDLLKRLGSKLGVVPLFLDWGGNPKGAFQMGFWSPNGETVEDILGKCISGEVKALFVSSVDLFRDYPHGSLVRDALSNVDLLVVHDMFFTETASYADCFIPATSFAEDGGTVLNMFWESQKRKKAFEPKGESLSLWQVALGLSREWGKPLGDFRVVEDVTPLTSQELAKAVEIPRISVSKEVPLDGDMPALFEYPFYRMGVNVDFCNAFVHLEPEPWVALNTEHAEELGFKEGDRVMVEAGDLKFHMKLLAKDEVPKGGAVVSLGFSDFPLTSALKGSWYRGIKLSNIKE